MRSPELTRTSLGAAIAELARQEQSDIVAAAYGGGIEDLAFDPRLIAKIAPAVARAAMESGAATRPLADFGAYPFCSEQECV